MSEQKTELHPWFHKFMICFALWAYGAFAVISGVQNLLYVMENGASKIVLDIILSVLLILLGLFVIKVRFDLAALREKAIRELTASCIAAALIFLAFHWVEDISGDDCYHGCIPKAVIFACWGIALYRYYSSRRDAFKE